jgi:tetratricopeptide (TPR) repeat protein
MSWLARLLGTDPDSRLRKARRLLDQGEHNEARMELEGLEGAEAEGLRQQALSGLVARNLEEARLRLGDKDWEGVKLHLELADTFGAASEQLRELRRELREARRAAEEAAARAEEEELRNVREGDDPLWSLPPDDPRLRYAMSLEGWPEDLRALLPALGPDFAAAVLLLEDGDPAGALQRIHPIAEREVVARLERARAALACGYAAVAATDLAVFAEAYGHRQIGSQHTALLLVEALVRDRRPAEALALMDAELQKAQSVSFLATRAQLLDLIGRLPEAEKSAEKALRLAPKDLSLHRLLARLREKSGNRAGAAAVLEGGLNSCCSNPGKCGSQPYDIASARALARLYLEDRVEPERTRELLAELSRHVQRQGWEDRYIAALVARNEGRGDVPELARRLLTELEPADPRRRMVEAALG